MAWIDEYKGVSKAGDEGVKQEEDAAQEPKKEPVAASAKGFAFLLERQATQDMGKLFYDLALEAFGGVKGRTQLPGMVDQAMAGEIPLDPFITYNLPLEKINEAFDLMHDGKAIRSVVHF